MPKPGPIPCWGLCGGDPAWRGKLGLPCTLCHGEGKLFYPPTAAEEWEAVRKIRDERNERFRQRRKPRPTRKRRARKRGLKFWQAVAERRRREAIEAAEFEKRRPTPAQLDELKGGFRCGKNRN